MLLLCLNHILGVYFTLSMLIVALSCLMTVVVLRVHFKGKYGVQLSERVRKYFLIPLTKITFIDLKKYSLHPMKTKVSYNMATVETFGKNIKRFELTTDFPDYVSVNKGLQYCMSPSCVSQSTQHRRIELILF
jgi:hypothetical protein